MPTPELIQFTPEILNYINKNKRLAKKNTQALLRLPTDDEIGQVLNTYVEKNGEKILETSTIITLDGIIGRNPLPLSDGSFNDFVFPKSVFLEHYGENMFSLLTTTFQPMYKKISAEVVLITDQLKILLKKFVDNKNHIVFMATFNLAMTVDIGDYFVINKQLQCVDYGIDGEQFKNTYIFLDHHPILEKVNELP